VVVLPPDPALKSEMETHRRAEQLDARRESADLEHQAREGRPTLVARLRALLRRKA